MAMLRENEIRKGGKRMKSKWVLMVGMILILQQVLLATPGKVYLVLGSDTAIWDGLGTGLFNCTLNGDLYTNPAGNTYAVMDPAFRAQLLDSYGNPLKMTWWMMAGAQFRYATNKDVPIPNIMTLYLMKKYHGENVIADGDELSLHYHTWKWTDYDNDGRWYWNQTLDFLECKDDFDFTLMQFLLDEQTFPVSFRSGWHYMDNNWQHYLDEILMYSMHNDYPSDRIDLIEPMDNTYHWAQAPADFVPFRPSYENYQIPGDGPGWNLRSAHLSTFRWGENFDRIFAKANTGEDQMACVWGHLPETDFLENIVAIDTILHNLANTYPDVKFRYCTAIEAMQIWQGARDSVAPVLTLTENAVGDEYYYTIQTDEPIFQRVPYVAAKDMYEQYTLLPCEAAGENIWVTTRGIPQRWAVKVGAVVCDTLGNQSMQFIEYLPDDQFIDNLDAGYSEQRGAWIDQAQCAWGTNSRRAVLAADDSVCARWNIDVEMAHSYNIFMQIPQIDNQAGKFEFRVYASDECIKTISFDGTAATHDWVYLATADFLSGSNNYVELVAHGDDQVAKLLLADVIKVSAFVKERDLQVNPASLNFGDVSQHDTSRKVLELSNLGQDSLTISSMECALNAVIIETDFPIVIPGMAMVEVPVSVSSAEKGTLSDSLVIHSDDPLRPVLSVPLSANIVSYFVVIDNEDTRRYSEYAVWHNSVAWAYGPGSRYSVLAEKRGAYAKFSATIHEAGVYDISEIVPTTVNASNNAAYILYINGLSMDTVIVDQNQGSGEWFPLWRYEIPANSTVWVKVWDTGKSTEGYCLRADAIKIALCEGCATDLAEDRSLLPLTFALQQNYPNPFNPTTTFLYTLPHEEDVRLDVYNMAGQLVDVLVKQNQKEGMYTVQWDAGRLSSGVYMYRLQAGEFSSVRKCILLK